MQPSVNLQLDGHVHTSLCRHATGEMEDYVRAAIERGLTTIIFLEHFEVAIHYSHRIWLTDEDFDFYFQEGERLRSRYGNQIEIRLGAEVGWNSRAADKLQKRLSRYPWEHLGLSCHFFWDGSRHLNLLSNRPENIALFADQDVDLILTTYLDSLLAGIQAIPCNVVCHLDAALRHVPGLHWSAEHLAQMDRLLTAINAAGARLEINTSGFAIRDQPFPATPILRRAYRLGIPFICGSDAHDPCQVGRYFDRIPGLLNEIITSEQVPPRHHQETDP